MTPKNCMLLLLAAKFCIASALDTSTLATYDCSGGLKEVCRKPFTCKRDFEAYCPVVGSSCCPVRRPLANPEIFLNRVDSNCRDRKCLVYYNGWWDNPCGHSSRTLFYCSKTDKFCCSAECRITSGCTDMGGHCVSNRKACDGFTIGSLCKGHSCYCCVPAASSTTTIAPVPTTTVAESTTAPTTPVPTTIAESTTAPTTPVPTTTIAESTTATTPVPTTTIAESTTDTTPVPTTTIAESTTDTTPVPTTTIAESTTATSPAPTTTTPEMTTTGPILPPCSLTGGPGVTCNYPTSCEDHGTDLSGIYNICPVSNCPPVEVMCMNDGWTVIMSRNTSATTPCDFQRTWDEYKEGFCIGMDEYWIGNEVIHTLTSSGSYQIIIHGVINETNTRTLAYDYFIVGDEVSKYQLTIGWFNVSGSNGIDLFVNPPSTNFILNGMKFSTFDQDNDNLETGSCSLNEEKGGWWFNDCSAIRVTRNSFILWNFWDDYPNYYPLGPDPFLSSFIMKIRTNY